MKYNYSSQPNGYRPQYRQQNTLQDQKVSFQQINYGQIVIRTRNNDVWNIIKPIMDKQNRIAKSLNGGYNGWIINIDKYREFLSILQSVKIRVETIPLFIRELLLPFNYYKYMEQITQSQYDYSTQSHKVERTFDKLPEQIRQNLFNFQKEGIQFGISKSCRLLIGDEMGVGKTIQALCLAYLYRDEWPLLIICPSCLRFTIRQEILHWFSEHIEESLIQVISKGTDQLLKKSEIVIISYDVVSNLRDVIEVKKFKTCILDEAHYLKSLDSLRSLNIVPLVQKMKNVILLTGTPALSRPRELFNILSIIRPDIFKDFKVFGYRYCNPRLNQIVNSINYDGCDNELELSFLLNEKIMIRRLKKDILPDLPPKRRKKVIVEISSNIRNKIKKAIKTADAKQFQCYLQNQMEQFQDQEYQDNHNYQQSQDIISKTFSYVYKETGIAKLESVKEYLSDLMESKTKLIIFAHHKSVLDELERMVQKDFRKQSIRIDGNVKQEDRVIKIKEFQTNPQITIAILSLQAASHGITLTASSHVIFAELYPTPAVMLQAEDRSHRINQKDNVLCHYIIAKDTIDEDIFGLLLSKYLVTSSILDGKRSSLQIDEYEEFQYQKEESQQNKNIESSIGENDNQQLDDLKQSQLLQEQFDQVLNKKYNEQELNQQQEVNEEEFKNNQENISRNEIIDLTKNELIRQQEIYISNNLIKNNSDNDILESKDINVNQNCFMKQQENQIEYSKSQSQENPNNTSILINRTEILNNINNKNTITNSLNHTINQQNVKQQLNDYILIEDEECIVVQDSNDDKDNLNEYLKQMNKRDSLDKQQDKFKYLYEAVEDISQYNDESNDQNDKNIKIQQKYQQNGYHSDDDDDDVKKNNKKIEGKSEQNQLDEDNNQRGDRQQQNQQSLVKEYFHNNDSEDSDDDDSIINDIFNILSKQSKLEIQPKNSFINYNKFNDNNNKDDPIFNNSLLSLNKIDQNMSPQQILASKFSNIQDNYNNKKDDDNINIIQNSDDTKKQIVSLPDIILNNNQHIQTNSYEAITSSNIQLKNDMTENINHIKLGNVKQKQLQLSQLLKNQELCNLNPNELRIVKTQQSIQNKPIVINSVADLSQISSLNTQAMIDETLYTISSQQLHSNDSSNQIKVINNQYNQTIQINHFKNIIPSNIDQQYNEQSTVIHSKCQQEVLSTKDNTLIESFVINSLNINQRLQKNIENVYSQSIQINNQLNNQDVQCVENKKDQQILQCINIQSEDQTKGLVDFQNEQLQISRDKESNNQSQDIKCTIPQDIACKILNDSKSLQNSEDYIIDKHQRSNNSIHQNKSVSKQNTNIQDILKIIDCDMNESCEEDSDDDEEEDDDDIIFAISLKNTMKNQNQQQQKSVHLESKEIQVKNTFQLTQQIENLKPDVNTNYDINVGYESTNESVSPHKKYILCQPLQFQHKDKTNDIDSQIIFQLDQRGDNNNKIYTQEKIDATILNINTPTLASSEKLKRTRDQFNNQDYERRKEGQLITQQLQKQQFKRK